MKKKHIVVTGGAGFVGSNLINLLLKKTKFKIISIDNYSSGFKKNHLKNVLPALENNAVLSKFVTVTPLTVASDIPVIHLMRPETASKAGNTPLLSDAQRC